MKAIISIDGLSYGDFDLEIMPNLKGLLQKGYGVQKVKTIFPSVTWAIHTTAMTGCLPEEHLVFGNQFIENMEEKCYWNDTVQKEDTIGVSTVYDVFAKTGKTIASICMPLTQGATNIKYNIPEFYSQEEFNRSCTKKFYDELQEAGYPMEHYGEWSWERDSVVLQDELTEQIMEYVLDNKNVDVLMGHFLAIDTMEHFFGCRAREVRFAMRFIDRLIGKLIQKLQDMGVWDTCDLVIFSDHGQTNIVEGWDIHRDLEESGLSNQMAVVDDGGCLHLYCKEDADTEKIETYFANHPKVARMKVLDKKIERQPNYQLALQNGVVTKEYAEEHIGGATHGFDPETCDAMNPFVICKVSKLDGTKETIPMSEIYDLMIK